MANTPLYQSSNTDFANGNLGLWFHKFPDKWEVSQCETIQKTNESNEVYLTTEWCDVANNLNDIDISELTDRKCDNKNKNTVGKQKFEFNKIGWIEDIAKKSESINKEGLEHLADRMQIFADAIVCYQTTEPMIIGMGLNHPIENGMLFHHTLGVPYLPGSSVKGLVRAWAEQWDNAEDEKLLRIFGSKNRFNEHTKNADTQAGSVLFFDALPVSKIVLKTDIMTPHYPDYYSKEGKTPPADNQKPIPIPFLAVAEGTTFQFIFKVRTSEDKSDMDLVKQWLSSALEHLGIGAKTAVGYGRMLSLEELDKREKSIAEAAIDANKEIELHKASDEWIEKTIKKIQENSNMSLAQRALLSNSLFQDIRLRQDKKYLATKVLEQQKELGLTPGSNKEKKAHYGLTKIASN